MNRSEISKELDPYYGKDIITNRFDPQKIYTIEQISGEDLNILNNLFHARCKRLIDGVTRCRSDKKRYDEIQNEIDHGMVLKKVDQNFYRKYNLFDLDIEIVNPIKTSDQINYEKIRFKDIVQNINC